MGLDIIEGLCDEFSGQLSGQQKYRKNINICAHLCSSNKNDDIYYVFPEMLFNGFLNAIYQTNKQKKNILKKGLCKA